MAACPRALTSGQHGPSVSRWKDSARPVSASTAGIPRTSPVSLDRADDQPIRAARHNPAQEPSDPCDAIPGM